MDGLSKENANPEVYSSEVAERVDRIPSGANDNTRDELDVMEVFEHIRHINDPEHPLTLEQLHVVTLEQIQVGPSPQVIVRFTPTIPHCSMATLIGLCIRVKLARSLPRRYKVSVRIAEGTHSSEAAVNKQLNDKERVAAAMENKHLLEVVNKCLSGSDKGASNIIPESTSIDALLGALGGDGDQGDAAQGAFQPAAVKLAALGLLK